MKKLVNSEMSNICGGGWADWFCTTATVAGGAAAAICWGLAIPTSGVSVAVGVGLAAGCGAYGFSQIG